MRVFKKIFIFSILTAFVVVLTSQMLLKNSEIRIKLSRLYEMESKYVFSEKEIKEGYIVINVSNPSNDLFLLQNGEKIMSLNSDRIEINIPDNSVVEIDGRNLKTQCSVKIIKISDNVDGFYEEKIDIKSNIKILGRFFVK